MKHVDKAGLLEALKARVADELSTVTDSHRRTTEGATHEEARPENDKDTRALEASYLARGLARRAEQLAEEAARLEHLRPRRFGEDDPVALGALVRLEDGDVERIYFIAPAGAGTRLDADGREVTVVTPASPLGRLLIGKRCDDDFEFRSPQGPRTLCILEVV